MKKILLLLLVIRAIEVCASQDNNSYGVHYYYDQNNQDIYLCPNPESKGPGTTYISTVEKTPSEKYTKIDIVGASGQKFLFYFIEQDKMCTGGNAIKLGDIQNRLFNAGKLYFAQERETFLKRIYNPIIKAALELRTNKTLENPKPTSPIIPPQPPTITPSVKPQKLTLMQELTATETEIATTTKEIDKLETKLKTEEELSEEAVNKAKLTIQLYKNTLDAAEKKKIEIMKKINEEAGKSLFHLAEALKQIAHQGQQ